MRLSSLERDALRFVKRYGLVLKLGKSWRAPAAGPDSPCIPPDIMRRLQIKGAIDFAPGTFEAASVSFAGLRYLAQHPARRAA